MSTDKRWFYYCFSDKQDSAEVAHIEPVQDEFICKKLGYGNNSEYKISGDSDNGYILAESIDAVVKELK